MRYLILLLVVLSSCSKNNREELKPESELEEVIEIKVDIEKAKELKMSDFFSKISYYPLETPDNSPIGLIDKIMIQGNNIALYDKTKRSVWVYTKSGEFLSEVKIPFGRGPSEIESLQDVYFDENLKIHALGVYNFLVVNLDGIVEKETSFDLFVRKFTYNVEQESYFGFAEGNPNTKIKNGLKGNNVFEFNADGEITEAFMPIEENRIAMGYGVPDNFPTYKGKHYYFQHLYDTVYTFEGNDLKPVYYLNFGENKLTEDVLDKSLDYGGTVYTWSDFWDNEVEPYDYVAYKTTFEIMDKYIFSRLGTANENHMILYDRKANTTHVGMNTFLNDIDYGPSPFIYLSSDQSLYSYVEANDFLRLMNRIYKDDRDLYYSNEMSRLRELANGMSNVKNPILMRLDFK